MLVILSLPAPEGNIWYLAYGSNLSSSKFVKDRGIIPLDTAVVSISGYTLAMDSAGVPYQEPSFASIRPIDLNALPKQEGALGTAYLVTSEQYAQIIASEGGGIAYREVSVEVEVVDKDRSKNGKGGRPRKIDVRTLVTVLQRLPAPRPSARYMVSSKQHLLLPRVKSELLNLTCVIESHHGWGCGGKFPSVLPTILKEHYLV